MAASIEVTCRQTPVGEITVITLDNGSLRLRILPEAGAKIESIVHLPTGTELLWQNPEREALPVSAGASYDDAWSGGWDELFPNDEPASVGGFRYPDHGELWTNSWEYRITSGGDLMLSTVTPVTACRVEKRIRLDDSHSKVRFYHRFTNSGSDPVPYLWKLHPALHVEQGDRLLIPADRFVLEPAAAGTLEKGEVEPGATHVRLADRTIDLLEVPPRESQKLHFFYGVDLREGWCGLYRPERKLAVGLAFPRNIFNTCWLFASYGGWRDYYVAVLEPCTGYPFRLEEIAAAGREAVLAPSASFEAKVVFTVEENLDGISRITPDGQILP
jgi:galactose mutarotase-like enzyme